MTEAIRTRSDEKALEEGCFYSQQHADAVRNWIETNCILSQDRWAGEHVKLIPWQVDFINQLYGWRRADGTRRFTRAALWIPKKNGKSTFLSSIANYHLGEKPGQQIVVLAPTKKQADIVFNEAASMVRFNEALRDNWNVRYHVKMVENRLLRSSMQVLSCAKHSQSGFSSSVQILDEIADFPTWGREVWEQVRYAGRGRSEPLLITLSTAQYDRSTFAYEQYTLAKEILSGEKILTDFLPVVYECPEDKWEDPEEWKKANPSWGYTINPDDFKKDYENVIANPSEEPAFKTLSLNIWSNPIKGWIPSGIWNQCKSDFKEEELWGNYAYIGLDMARSCDLAAYCVWVKQDGVYYMLPRAFSPEATALAKEKSDGVPYRFWASRNWIKLIEGDLIDGSVIRDYILRDAEHFKIREIRYDPNLASDTANALNERGFDCIPVAQTYTHLSQAVIRFERLTKERLIRHPDNPCANWCIGNCVLRTNTQDQALIHKAKSTGRVDIASAAVIGLTGVMAWEDDEAWAGPLVM